MPYDTAALSWSRRRFLATNTVAAATAALSPRRRGARLSGPPHCALDLCSSTPLRDPRVKTLVLRALDAARSAGATYADVRLTYTQEGTETEDLGFGIRALVNGYWGFAASPYLTEDEAPRLAHEAVTVARAAGAGVRRVVEWTPMPPVSDGDWRTPIRIDPYDLAPQELMDWQYGLRDYIIDRGTATGGVTTTNVGTYYIQCGIRKQERVFASTDETYLTQTVQMIDLMANFDYRGIYTGIDFLTPVAAGWEYVIDQEAKMRAELPRLFAAAAEKLRTPVKRVDIGRYDVIFSARAMATLLGVTLGPATQVDRALGYEANAQGTSYLGPDPLALLGSKIASSSVSVTANRSHPLGLATVKWDDEGVAPADFPIITDGVLVDYQTTREQAAWLAPYYQKQGHPIQSHGCAAAPSALELTMQHTPNLVLEPGHSEQDFEALIAGMESGLAIDGDVRVDIDHQKLNGVIYPGTVYTVKHGKRVERTDSRTMPIAFLFRTPELWGHVQALGGPASQRWFGLQQYSIADIKGEPQQIVAFSAGAVPAVIQQLAVINPMRKA